MGKWVLEGGEEGVERPTAIESGLAAKKKEEFFFLVKVVELRVKSASARIDRERESGGFKTFRKT